MLTELYDARSNYFAVKDLGKLTSALDEVLYYQFGGEAYSLETIVKNGKTLYSIRFHSDLSFFPVTYITESGGIEYIDWPGIFMDCLEDGWVAILMAAGITRTWGIAGLQRVEGYAYAFNSKGESREIQLSDIYHLAKDLGEHVTQVKPMQ
jgi:hypothetical protein